MATNDGLREISANEVLAEIENGHYIHYDHVIIKGDIDISSLNLPKDKDGRKVLEMPLRLENCQIHGKIVLSEAIVKFGILVRDTQIRDDVYISSEFYEKFGFACVNSVFCGHAFFSGSKFRGEVSFCDSEFIGITSFNDAEFMRYTDFSRTKFKYLAFFEGAQFGGDMLTFKDAEFKYKQNQENACRKAKQLMDKAGNREEADYHFYREMEAKRKQKGIYDTSISLYKTHPTQRAENLTVIWQLLWYDFVEYLFIQKMFGYGVYPKRLMISWGAIVLAFGFVYWFGKGIIGTTEWLDFFKVSFATAIAPGYIAAIINPASAGYRLVPPYQIVAMMETIIGTFFWAGFIATFAKKYMR